MTKRHLVTTARRLVKFATRWDFLALVLLVAPRILWFESDSLVTRGDLIYPLRGADFYGSLNGAWRDVDLGVVSVFQPRLARPLYWFSALSDFSGLNLTVSEVIYVFVLSWLAAFSIYFLFVSFIGQ